MEPMGGASGAKPKLSGFKGGGLDNKYVQLNVVGSLYYTTVRVLTQRDTMLKAMFSERMEVLTDKEVLYNEGTRHLLPLQGARILHKVDLSALLDAFGICL
uniref:Uncharacterized protein n=1 Tax=Marmota marmota marmota TaxID=9994 RepID=A0A8C6A7P3_MARMA